MCAVARSLCFYLAWRLSGKYHCVLLLYMYNLYPAARSLKRYRLQHLNLFHKQALPADGEKKYRFLIFDQRHRQRVSRIQFSSDNKVPFLSALL